MGQNLWILFWGGGEMVAETAAEIECVGGLQKGQSLATDSAQAAAVSAENHHYL